MRKHGSVLTSSAISSAGAALSAPAAGSPGRAAAREAKRQKKIAKLLQRVHDLERQASACVDRRERTERALRELNADIAALSALVDDRRQRLLAAAPSSSSLSSSLSASLSPHNLFVCNSFHHNISPAVSTPAPAPAPAPVSVSAIAVPTIPATATTTTHPMSTSSISPRSTSTNSSFVCGACGARTRRRETLAAWAPLPRTEDRSSSPLLALPPAVLFRILAALGPRDRASVACTCRELRFAVQNMRLSESHPTEAEQTQTQEQAPPTATTPPPTTAITLTTLPPPPLETTTTTTTTASSELTDGVEEDLGGSMIHPSLLQQLAPLVPDRTGACCWEAGGAGAPGGSDWQLHIDALGTAPPLVPVLPPIPVLAPVGPASPVTGGTAAEGAADTDSLSDTDSDSDSDSDYDLFGSFSSTSSTLSSSLLHLSDAEVLEQLDSFISSAIAQPPAPGPAPVPPAGTP